MDGESELTRRVRFDASHAYRRRDWSDDANAAAFGALGRSHGHAYTLDVTVGGPLDATGFLVDLAALDAAVEGLVGPLRGGLLNEVVEAFRPGALQPTTEALARWAWRELAGRLPHGIELREVRVAESDELWATYRG